MSPFLHISIYAIKGFPHFRPSMPPFWAPSLHCLGSLFCAGAPSPYKLLPTPNNVASFSSFSSSLPFYSTHLCFPRWSKAFVVNSLNFLPCGSSTTNICVLIPFPFLSINTASLCTSSSLSVVEDSSSCSVSDVQDSRGTLSDSGKLYRAIAEKSGSEERMEDALGHVGVMLTTKIVDEVLERLRYEEKLALRFFMWSGHQEGYSHQAQTYNCMIDILSSTRYKAKQFSIICDILDYMKRKEKNSVPVDVLLTILRKYTEKYLTHLQKFTKKKRVRVKTQPEINAFNLLLDSLCKCSLVEEAETMLRKVKNKINPDANTYNILFFGWCRVRNPAKAMKVLEEMIQIGHTPDNFTYNTAIQSFCGIGMISEALELFEFMRTKGSTISSPTARTYSTMIVALSKFNRMDDCFTLLSEMKSSGCLPDVSTYKELIEGMCLAEKIDEAYKFLHEMGNKGYPPDIVTYNCFLKVLCDLRKSDEALKLVGRMIETGCNPSVHSYNMLISMFFKIGEPDGAFDTWHEMDKRDCKRDVDSYCVMIEGLFDSNMVENACYLLEDVVNIGMKLPYKQFDAFLMQLSTLGDLRAIHRLSEHMRKFYNPAMARRFAVSQKRKSNSLRRK